jgi:hypothetical protein
MNASRYVSRVEANVVPIRLLQSANDNARIDRTAQQVNSIGLACIGLLGMFGVLLLTI